MQAFAEYTSSNVTQHLATLPIVARSGHPGAPHLRFRLQPGWLSFVVSDHCFSVGVMRLAPGNSRPCAAVFPVGVRSLSNE